MICMKISSCIYALWPDSIIVVTFLLLIMTFCQVKSFTFRTLLAFTRQINMISVSFYHILIWLFLLFRGDCWEVRRYKDDVFTMTSSNGNIIRVTGPLCEEFPVTGEFPARRPVTRSLMFSLICAWINGWVNNREAGDLRPSRPL